MELVHHLCWIRIELLVKLHGIPAVLAPVLPVLDDKVDRNLLLAESPCSSQELLLRMESFAAVDVSQSP